MNNTLSVRTELVEVPHANFARGLRLAQPERGVVTCERVSV